MPHRTVAVAHLFSLCLLPLSCPFPFHFTTVFSVRQFGYGGNNNLRLDDYLLHLLNIMPERAEQNKDFEMDDLLPWSEEMKSWFSAV